MERRYTTLAPFYAGWDRYQTLLCDAIAPLSAEQLALRPSPSLRSVGEIARHIIGARARWFQIDFGEGGPEIEPLQKWDGPSQPALSGAELVHGLTATWEMMADCLNRWTPAMLDDEFESDGEVDSRQWIIWHLIEHDLHHGGELFFTLGMHGLPTPDL